MLYCLLLSTSTGLHFFQFFWHGDPEEHVGTEVFYLSSRFLCVCNARRVAPPAVAPPSSLAMGPNWVYAPVISHFWWSVWIDSSKTVNHILVDHSDDWFMARTIFFVNFDVAMWLKGRDSNSIQAASAWRLFVGLQVAGCDPKFA